jgi:hypothetical protein
MIYSTSSQKSELIIEDYFNLNTVLTKMSLNKSITEEERESLLAKTGLIKVNSEQWKTPEGSVLKFTNK